jgi:thiol:disulfide interchange protein DsbD
MKKYLLISIISLCFSSNVDFTASVDRPDVIKGEYIKITFDINIDKGFFIYSTKEDLSLSPTKIIWSDSTFFSNSSLFFEPTPKIKFDENFDMNVSYHTNSIKLSQYFLTTTSIDQNITQLNGVLFYQVCDASQCIRHFDDFSVDVNILDGDIREPFSEIPVTQNPYGENMLDKAIESGFLSFILLSFGMGLLALLTPCVFPMIPITVSFFTKQGEKENNNPLKSAIIYALGIIIIFTSLGLVLAVTLGASGANQIASNPFINLFIALLFVFFALSLFGMYEIQAPSSLRQFSLENENQTGISGILFMALTFTLTSFTCTVQFVGLLLVAASQGSYMWPIFGMLIFSFAFSLPFFFLALFPQYLSRLPKSGQWMNSIKVTMGFLELGAAMKFFSNVDLVWEIGFFTYDIVLITWAILSILTGIYLLGLIKFPHDMKLQKRGPIRISLSIIFLSFGLYLSNGLYTGKVHGLIESYLPPKIEKGWIENYQEAILVAMENDKPIFLDFTGYTCTNCRWMEKNIFIEQEVEELFENFILVKLYTDGGEHASEYQQMEIDRYGTSALPFYVVIDKYENKINTFHGMDPDVNKFIDFLNTSLERFRN